jgi:hypothetical protein
MIIAIGLLMIASFLMGRLIERERGPYKKLFRQALDNHLASLNRQIKNQEKLKALLQSLPDIQFPVKSPIQINHET